MGRCQRQMRHSGRHGQILRVLALGSSKSPIRMGIVRKRGAFRRVGLVVGGIQLGLEFFISKSDQIEIEILIQGCAFC